MALVPKQRAFVEEYVKCWNASEAARRAGYSEKTAGSIGHENLKKPEISAEIERRVAESKMSSDEVLVRLADEGRGSLGDFMDIAEDGLPQWNFKKAEAANKLHLMRKIKTKTVTTHRTRGEVEEDITEVEVSLELYSAQAAKEILAKHHKLLTDKIDVHHSGAIDFSADEAAQADKELKDWEQQQSGLDS